MEIQKLQKKKRKAAEEKNTSQLAIACKNLGDYYVQQSDYNKALREYKQEAEIYEQQNNKLKHAIANRWIGESYLGLEEFEAALRHVEVYLKITLELDDKIETERAYTSLGRVYLTIGQIEDAKISTTVNPKNALKQAEKCFIKGVLMCKQLVGQVTNHELTDMKARLYLNLSLTKESAGEMQKALEFMTKAVALCKCGELFEILHKCYVAMSGQYVKLNDNQNALRYINLASDVAERLSNRVAKCCETWITYASILIRSGDFQSAKQVLMKAYKLKSPIEADRQSIESNLRTVAALCKTEDELIVVYSGDYKRRRELYEKMGDGSCALGNYEKAAIYYENSLENAKLNKEKGADLIPIYVSLYETYRDLKEYRKALKYMWEEFELCKTNPKEATLTLLSIAETTHLSGDSSTVSEDILKQALKSAKQSEDKDLVVKVLKRMFERYTDTVSESSKLTNLKEELESIGMTVEQLKELPLESNDEDNMAADDKTDTPNIGDEICLETLSGSDSEPDADEEETNATKRISLRKRTGMSNKIKRNAKGETDLHTACIAGNVAAVKRLLSAGHPLNVRDNAGWLPLHEAANHGFCDIVQLLVENGGAALINDRGDSSCEGITPLHDACSNGHLEVVELLLDKGANPTARTDTGETPLDFLTIWRKDEGTLEPGSESFYETLRLRLDEALKKVCLPDVRLQKQAKPEIKSRALHRNSSDKENTIGNLRMGILDDDDSSNDSVVDRTRSRGQFTKRKNTEATEMYKSAMNNLRNKGGVVSSDVQNTHEQQATKKRTAYLQSQELEADDWLEEDVLLQETKKRRYMPEETLPKRTTSLSLKKKDPHRPLSDSVAQDKPLIIGESRINAAGSSGSEAFDLIMNAKQTQGRKLNTSKRRSSQGSNTGKNQSSLIHAGFSRTVLGDDDEDSNDVVDSGITSPVKSNRSSTLNHSTGNSSAFLTMKVKIEDQLIVVPVKSTDMGNCTMKWLAENAAKRYENIHGRLPFLSLCTTDGAIFDDNDPMEVVMDIKPYISTKVKRWIQKSLCDSYVACCVISKQDVNNAILSRLQMTNGQKVVDLSNLNVSAMDMEALLKSLQCNSEVTQLDLSNNLIDDRGVINVCQAVVSLSQLRCLNLSGNVLTVDGIMKIENQLSVARGCLRELSELNLSFNNISDAGLRYVSSICNGLPRLSKLSLKSCRLTKLEDLQETLNRLVSLDLSHNSFTNLRTLWSNLNGQVIQELNFDLAISSGYSTFSRELIDFLNSEKPNLRCLFLGNCKLTDSLLWELLQSLRAKGSLKRLSLMNNSMLSSMSLVALLRSNLHLEELNLRGCNDLVVDFNMTSLSEISADITMLPRKLIMAMSSAKEKQSLTSALQNLWISHFGHGSVRVDGTTDHTLIITCNTDY